MPAIPWPIFRRHAKFWAGSLKWQLKTRYASSSGFINDRTLVSTWRSARMESLNEALLQARPAVWDCRGHYVRRPAFEERGRDFTDLRPSPPPVAVCEPSNDAAKSR